MVDRITPALRKLRVYSPLPAPLLVYHHTLILPRFGIGFQYNLNMGSGHASHVNTAIICSPANPLNPCAQYNITGSVMSTIQLHPTVGARNMALVQSGTSSTMYFTRDAATGYSNDVSINTNTNGSTWVRAPYSVWILVRKPWMRFEHSLGSAYRLSIVYVSYFVAPSAESAPAS